MFKKLFCTHEYILKERTEKYRNPYNNAQWYEETYICKHCLKVKTVSIPLN